MAFTKFECDVENISALPDEPSQEDGYTAQKIKSLFDKAAADIKNYVNNTLIPQLEAKEASASLGSGDISGLNAENNIFSQISALKALLDGIKAGGFDEGSITPDKLDSTTQNFIKNLDSRCVIYTIPGTHSYSVPKSGLYKITVAGAGAAGSHFGGGMSGAYGVRWMTLNKNEQISLSVGAGGKMSGEGGGDSVFSGIIAEGGKANQEVYTSFSACHNANIEIGGTVSVCQNIADNAMRMWGGDSPLGRGSRTENIPAGHGAGGFGNGDIYTEGGNGMVIIEYLHIQ